jgi:hypothetical protein
VGFGIVRTFEAHPTFGDWFGPPGGIILGGDYHPFGDSLLESLLAGKVGVKIRHFTPPKNRGKPQRKPFFLRTTELYHVENICQAKFFIFSNRRKG